MPKSFFFYDARLTGWADRPEKHLTFSEPALSIFTFTKKKKRNNIIIGKGPHAGAGSVDLWLALLLSSSAGF